MESNWNLLRTKAEEFKVPLNNLQIEQFKEYWKFLDEYNQHTNLVSNSEQEIVVKKHFIDSLAIGLLKDKLCSNNVKHILDVGIGGGFPGIPLIIANPAWKLCAIDSVGKKTKFLELLSKKLGIEEKVEIITGRAEEIAHDVTKRECFDLVIARAVSQLPILLEYTLPFIKKGGHFIAYKAKSIQEEIEQSKKALEVLGGEIKDLVSYELPEDVAIQRKLIVIEKTQLTPKTYPRKTGIPKKYPLN